jgi:hypothetical protein
MLRFVVTLALFLSLMLAGCSGPPQPKASGGNAITRRNGLSLFIAGVFVSGLMGQGAVSRWEAGKHCRAGTGRELRQQHEGATDLPGRGQGVS